MEATSQPDAPTSQLTPARLQLLRCVVCGQAMGQRQAPPPALWHVLQPQLADIHLQCTSCAECYPVTTEGIPIMWTASLRSCLLNEAGAESTLSANVNVYDEVSDDYARYWRKSSRNALRMQAAAAAALAGTSAPGRWHLDIGCGPGHVLHWLSDLGLQQVALDVSLNNLRNVVRSTSAFAVLGSADRLPFADHAFALVTESSVLHHIDRWQDAVAECARVCGGGGGIVIDSEPSRESKEWSRLASALFEMRWYPYMLLSYVTRRKFWFRNVKTARMTFERAEIHNRPNTGLPVEEMVSLLEARGLVVDTVRSPNERLEPKGRMSWQEMILHAASGHNPFSAKYGWFTLVARRS